MFLNPYLQTYQFVKKQIGRGKIVEIIQENEFIIDDDDANYNF